jgi:hypothetical protein
MTGSSAFNVTGFVLGRGGETRVVGVVGGLFELGFCVGSVGF